MKSILRIVSSVGVNCKPIESFNGGDRFGNFSMIIFTNLFLIISITKVYKKKEAQFVGTP